MQGCGEDGSEVDLVVDDEDLMLALSDEVVVERCCSHCRQGKTRMGKSAATNLLSRLVGEDDGGVVG